ncbi:MAG: diaminopimelate epimerase [Pygmaiobacter massiliensis]|nr:diaminopimelate epimerase [Pygmaiobacter massiliensis]
MQTISLYSGAGNRFVVLDRPDKISEEQLGALSKTLCGKAQGFGVDGALYLVRQQSIWRMLYFNKDGSRAAFCGNGLRCFASHLYRTGRVHTKTFLVQTDCGLRRAVILHHDLVQVEMGNARFCPCPKLPLPDFVQKAVLVEMNVPHLVLFTKKQPADLVERWGPVFEKNPAFLHRVNVNFVQKNGAKLKIATFERGAGHTLACGTGCCAAAFAAGLKAGQKMLIRAEGGLLWAEENAEERLYLTGPARCTGQLRAVF